MNSNHCHWSPEKSRCSVDSYTERRPAFVGYRFDNYRPDRNNYGQCNIFEPENSYNQCRNGIDFSGASNRGGRSYDPRTGFDHNRSSVYDQWKFHRGYLKGRGRGRERGRGRGHNYWNIRGGISSHRMSQKRPSDHDSPNSRKEKKRRLDEAEGNVLFNGRTFLCDDIDQKTKCNEQLPSNADVLRVISKYVASRNYDSGGSLVDVRSRESSSSRNKHSSRESSSSRDSRHSRERDHSQKRSSKQRTSLKRDQSHRKSSVDGKMKLASVGSSKPKALVPGSTKPLAEMVNAKVNGCSNSADGPLLCGNDRGTGMTSVTKAILKTGTMDKVTNSSSSASSVEKSKHSTFDKLKASKSTSKVSHGKVGSKQENGGQSESSSVVKATVKNDKITKISNASSLDNASDSDCVKASLSSSSCGKKTKDIAVKKHRHSEGASDRQEKHNKKRQSSGGREKQKMVVTSKTVSEGTSFECDNDVSGSSISSERDESLPCLVHKKRNSRSDLSTSVSSISKGHALENSVPTMSALFDVEDSVALHKSTFLSDKVETTDKHSKVDGKKIPTSTGKEDTYSNRHVTGKENIEILKTTGKLEEDNQKVPKVAVNEDGKQKHEKHKSKKLLSDKGSKKDGSSRPRKENGEKDVTLKVSENNSLKELASKENTSPGKETAEKGAKVLHKKSLTTHKEKILLSTYISSESEGEYRQGSIIGAGTGAPTGAPTRAPTKDLEVTVSLVKLSDHAIRQYSEDKKCRDVSIGNWPKTVDDCSETSGDSNGLKSGVDRKGLFDLFGPEDQPKTKSKKLSIKKSPDHKLLSKQKHRKMDLCKEKTESKHQCHHSTSPVAKDQLNVQNSNSSVSSCAPTTNEQHKISQDNHMSSVVHSERKERKDSSTSSPTHGQRKTSNENNASVVLPKQPNKTVSPTHRQRRKSSKDSSGSTEVTDQQKCKDHSASTHTPTHRQRKSSWGSSSSSASINSASSEKKKLQHHHKSKGNIKRKLEEVDDICKKTKMDTNGEDSTVDDKTMQVAHDLSPVSLQRHASNRDDPDSTCTSLSLSSCMDSPSFDRSGSFNNSSDIVESGSGVAMADLLSKPCDSSHNNSKVCERTGSLDVHNTNTTSDSEDDQGDNNRLVIDLNCSIASDTGVHVEKETRLARTDRENHKPGCDDKQDTEIDNNGTAVDVLKEAETSNVSSEFKQSVRDLDGDDKELCLDKTNTLDETIPYMQDSMENTECSVSKIAVTQVTDVKVTRTLRDLPTVLKKDVLTEMANEQVLDTVRKNEHITSSDGNCFQREHENKNSSGLPIVIKQERLSPKSDGGDQRLDTLEHTEELLLPHISRTEDITSSSKTCTEGFKVPTLPVEKSAKPQVTTEISFKLPSDKSVNGQTQKMEVKTLDEKLCDDSAEEPKSPFSFMSSQEETDFEDHDDIKMIVYNKGNIQSPWTPMPATPSYIDHSDDEMHVDEESSASEENCPKYLHEQVMLEESAILNHIESDSSKKDLGEDSSLPEESLTEESWQTKKHMQEESGSHERYMHVESGSKEEEGLDSTVKRMKVTDIETPLMSCGPGNATEQLSVSTETDSRNYLTPSPHVLGVNSFLSQENHGMTRSAHAVASFSDPSGIGEIISQEDKEKSNTATHFRKKDNTNSEERRESNKLTKIKVEPLSCREFYESHCQYPDVSTNQMQASYPSTDQTREQDDGLHTVEDEDAMETPTNREALDHVDCITLLSDAKEKPSRHPTSISRLPLVSDQCCGENNFAVSVQRTVPTTTTSTTSTTPPRSGTVSNGINLGSNFERFMQKIEMINNSRVKLHTTSEQRQLLKDLVSYLQILKESGNKYMELPVKHEKVFMDGSKHTSNGHFSPGHLAKDNRIRCITCNECAVILSPIEFILHLCGKVYHMQLNMQMVLQTTFQFSTVQQGEIDKCARHMLISVFKLERNEICYGKISNSSQDITFPSPNDHPPVSISTLTEQLSSSARPVQREGQDSTTTSGQMNGQTLSGVNPDLMEGQSQSLSTSAPIQWGRSSSTISPAQRDVQSSSSAKGVAQSVPVQNMRQSLGSPPSQLVGQSSVLAPLAQRDSSRTNAQCVGQYLTSTPVQRVQHSSSTIHPAKNVEPSKLTTVSALGSRRASLNIPTRTDQYSPGTAREDNTCSYPAGLLESFAHEGVDGNSGSALSDTNVQSGYFESQSKPRGQRRTANLLNTDIDVGQFYDQYLGQSAFPDDDACKSSTLGQQWPNSYVMPSRQSETIWANTGHYTSRTSKSTGMSVTDRSMTSCSRATTDALRITTCKSSTLASQHRPSVGHHGLSSVRNSSQYQASCNPMLPQADGTRVNTEQQLTVGSQHSFGLVGTSGHYRNIGLQCNNWHGTTLTPSTIMSQGTAGSPFSVGSHCPIGTLTNSGTNRTTDLGTSTFKTPSMTLTGSGNTIGPCSTNTPQGFIASHSTTTATSTIGPTLAAGSQCTTGPTVTAGPPYTTGPTVTAGPQGTITSQANIGTHSTLGPRDNFTTSCSSAKGTTTKKLSLDDQNSFLMSLDQEIKTEEDAFQIFIKGQMMQRKGVEWFRNTLQQTKVEMEIMDRNHKEETRKRKELEDTMKEKLNKFQIIIDEKMAAFSHMNEILKPDPS